MICFGLGKREKSPSSDTSEIAIVLPTPLAPEAGRPDCITTIRVTADQSLDPVVLFGFLFVRGSDNSAEMQSVAMVEEKSGWPARSDVCNSTASCHISGHYAAICSVFAAWQCGYLALKQPWPEPDHALLRASGQGSGLGLIHRHVIILPDQLRHGDRF